MAPHTSSATPEQIEALLNFLDEHRDLARGRLRSVEGKLQAKRLWEELCNQLNAMGGSIKTVQQWQKVWFDRKHLSKKAAAESRRSASATGGGPSTAPQLSQWDLKVLSIMGDGFGDRQTGARVPAFPESLEPSTASSSYVDSQEGSQPIQLSQLSESASQPQESSTSRRSSPPTQHRRSHRRSQSAADSVRSRLFRFEEERVERERIRNTELAGIRVALEELCGLIREYLDR